MTNYRILYVEDEKILGKLVLEILQKEGYEPLLISGGGEVVANYNSFKPHICLLDVMLPGKDGFEIAAQLRHIDKEIPIIFLTARIRSEDVVTGFNAGCNDYIRKPFSSDELLIRIRYWLKEKYGDHNNLLSEQYRIGDIIFNAQRNTLELKGELTTLTFKETLLLQILVTNRNNIISRSHILNKIWGDDSIYYSRTLDVYITRLRKLFSNTPNQIVTLKGVGYRFISETG